MNAGLSSLAALKAQILAASLRNRSDFDAQLLALGLGAASAIEGNLGRTLARAEDDVLLLAGGTALYSLPRYPLEEVSQVEYRERVTDAWSDGSTEIENFSPAAGLLYLSAPLVGPTGQVRITYTGGWWWDTSEDASGTLPTGATALPGAILSAWHMQVDALWRAKDKLGTQIAKEPASAGGTANLTSIDLLPIVVSMLAPHRRLAV